MFNLNDPLLQAIMASLVQQQQSQQAGITPAFAQGAQPVSSGPMTSIGLNQPLNVSPQRAATLSPLEQQLSQAANMRAAAQPDADRLAFEQNTLGFLDTINQQNTGVYDRQQQLIAQAQMKQAEMDTELKKARIPEETKVTIEKMRLAAGETKDAAQRDIDLDKVYLEGISAIAKSQEILGKDKPAAIKLLKDERQKLSAAKAVDPNRAIKALQEEIERQRKAGISDDKIKAQLIADTEANPQFADAGLQALDYLSSTSQLAKPTYLPSRTSKSAPAQGKASTERTIPKVTPETFGEISAQNKARSVVESLQGIEATGGKSIPPDKISGVLAQARKQYNGLPRGMGWTFPEWVARNIFGTVDYGKVAELIRAIEGG